jgi:hypothetical protein
MPEGTKYFSMQCRTGFDVRWAFETGKAATPTAPYATLKSGQAYNSPEKMGWSYTEDIAQVDTLTIAGTWAQNDTVALTIGSDTVTITIGALTTTTQVATTIKQAWEGEAFTDTAAKVSPSTGGLAYTSFSAITAAESALGDIVTLTHDSAGHSFTLSATATTAGNGTATQNNETRLDTSANGNLYFASSEAGVVTEIVVWKDIR